MLHKSLSAVKAEFQSEYERRKHEIKQNILLLQVLKVVQEREDHYSDEMEQVFFLVITVNAQIIPY